MQLSSAIDIYSLGVILLELLTKKLANEVTITETMSADVEFDSDLGYFFEKK